jgi:hypothetical protein
MRRSVTLIIVAAMAAFLVLVSAVEESLDKAFPKNSFKASVYDPERPPGHRWHSQDIVAPFRFLTES